jgi:hypothetical protein
MQSLLHRFSHTLSCPINAALDVVIDCLESHRPGIQLHLGQSNINEGLISLAELVRPLSSPLLNTLDIQVGNEYESRRLLQEVTKTPKKLQALRLPTYPGHLPEDNAPPIMGLGDFEKLVAAFPGLQDLAIDMGADNGKWARIQKATTFHAES